MSSDSGGGLTAIIERAERIGEMENTIPTQDELEAQVRLSERMVAGHRRGKCCVECHRVEDGIAFRLLGSQQADPWQWMRAGDFDDNFLLWEIVDPAELAELYRRIDEQSLLLNTAVQCMGIRSLKRFSNARERDDRKREIVLNGPSGPSGPSERRRKGRQD